MFSVASCGKITHTEPGKQRPGPPPWELPGEVAVQAGRRLWVGQDSPWSQESADTDPEASGVAWGGPKLKDSLRSPSEPGPGPRAAPRLWLSSSAPCSQPEKPVEKQQELHFELSFRGALGAALFSRPGPSGALNEEPGTPGVPCTALCCSVKAPHRPRQDASSGETQAGRTHEPVGSVGTWEGSAPGRCGLERLNGQRTEMGREASCGFPRFASTDMQPQPLEVAGPLSPVRAWG